MSICRHKNHIPDKFRTNNVLCLDCNVSIHKDAVKPSYDELQAEVERLLLERQTVEHDLAEANKSIRVLEMENGILQSQVKSLEEALSASEKEVENLKAEIKYLGDMHFKQIDEENT